MAFIHSPSIVRDGLVMCLDAANPKSYGPTTVEALVVAGGGGGGVCYAGGGGGGGLLYSSALPVTAGTAYSITVGTGGTNQVNVSGNGGNGGNSVFSTLTAIGGGGGGGSCGSTGLSGGSGGGGSSTGATISAGGAGTTGQGYAGNSSPAANGGGGGGAGNGGLTANQKGNPGLAFSISGRVVYYGGGGSGGGSLLTGGIGGGGTGGTALGSGVADATPNTGGGGGGSIISGTGISGVGGTGIVIIRYRGPQKATGGTITTVNGDTVHTFTTSGTFTAGTNWGDLSGNNITGTLTNGPTYSSANAGSIVFDGVNDYIDLNSNNIITGTNPFTFDCFYTMSAAYNSELFGNYPAQGAGAIWIAGRYGVWFTTGYLYFPGAPLALGTYYMAITRTSGGAIVLYLNGVQVATGTNTTSITAGANFRIGSDTPGYGEQLGGSIYNMKVYNRVLTATEVLQNFNAHRGRYGI